MSNIVTERPSGTEASQGQAFEFEAVTVNLLGEIVARSTHTAVQITEDLGNGIILEMVIIPEGTFLMGSRPGQGYDDEHPQHRVRVSSFLMSKHPITQEQWDAVMDYSPPYRCSGEKRPADRISWHNAVEFCDRLSRQTGRGYRLPSEAEWEYACRARTTTPFVFGDTITTNLANYVGEHTYRSEPKGVYRHVTTEIGSFPPNPFGLYDVHGNVWEWCADPWHDNYVGAPSDGSVWESSEPYQYILRGGCWHDPPDLCRSATRLKHVPHEGEDYFGFRVALTSLERHDTSSIRPARTPDKQRLSPLKNIGRRIRTWLRR